MKRLLILFLVAMAGLIGGFHEWTARADAAISCPSERLGLAVFNTANNTVGPTSWDATCVGAMWSANFYLEHEVNGRWSASNCVNTSPCYIRRPTSGYFSSGQSPSGTVTFAPLNGCELRYRVRMTLQGKGGNGFSFVSNSTTVC